MIDHINIRSGDVHIVCRRITVMGGPGIGPSRFSIQVIGGIFSSIKGGYTQLLIILMATTTTRIAARMTRTISRYSVSPMSSFSAG